MDYPTFYTVGLHSQTPTLTPVCQAWRQFVPLILMVFGMIMMGCEPTTYRMRGHINHY